MTEADFIAAKLAKKYLGISSMQWHLLAKLAFSDGVTFDDMIALLYPDAQYKPFSWEKIPSIYIARLKKIILPHIPNFKIEHYVKYWRLSSFDRVSIIGLVNKLQTSIKTVDIEARFAYNDWFMAYHVPTKFYIPSTYDSTRRSSIHATQETHAPRLWRSPEAVQIWLGRNKPNETNDYLVKKVKLIVETNNAKAT